MELTRGSLADLLGRRVVDGAGTALGRIREVEVIAGGGDEPVVAALLVGRGALRARLWNRAARGAARVAWSDVVELDDAGRILVRPGAGAR